MRHVFISPHMDDAVFSAGDLILNLIKRNESVYVISVFTEFGRGPISAHSRKYLRCSGISALRSFRLVRKREDRLAMKKLRVQRYHHLDFVDAGFRLRDHAFLLAHLLANFGLGSKFLYPYHDTRSLYSGQLAAEDVPLQHQVFNILQKVVRADDTIYGPLAIGRHADHLITKWALEHFKNKKYYWLDQYYANMTYAKVQQLNLLRNYKLLKELKPTEEKFAIAQCYTSQIRCLFPVGIHFQKESIYEEKY